MGHHAPAEADELLHVRLRAGGVDRPSIVAAPRYFRGELGLGGLMQTSQAFQQVQDALSFFVQSVQGDRGLVRRGRAARRLRAALERVRRQSSGAAACGPPRGNPRS